MASMSSTNRDRHERPQDEDRQGYNPNIDKIREEYPMLQGRSSGILANIQRLCNASDTTYLDHAGTTLYPKSLIESFSNDMMSNLYGNPHSASSSSQLSTRRIEDVRLRALRLFEADPDHFDLIFVANATAGIKMVMEAFRAHEEGFWYGYHRDSHTSLVGVREAARAGQHCFTSDEEVEGWLGGKEAGGTTGKQGTIGLFAYPAQSNMNGRRLPLSWSERLRVSRHGEQTYSLLDAAALVSTSFLDLSNASAAPDFTVLSFYKMFGFPDLGALVVRKDSSAPLRRRSYFGGGTVEMVSCGEESWHISKQGDLHELLEDGTLPIHNIIALDSALNTHTRLFGSLRDVAAHTAFLAEQLYKRLSALRHYNGTEVCEIYKDPSAHYGASHTQGPIVALNFKNSRNDFVSNTEVEKLAIIRNIQLRSGGLCNPGGVASSLGLKPWEMRRNFSAGHRCGNENDIIGDKPTGMLRLSFGAMSNLQDVETFVKFAEEFFVDREPEKSSAQALGPSYGGFHVESLTIYPIKSCGGWHVPLETNWIIRDEGLAWDREWCLVHQGTRKALSQKKYPNMALLRPRMDLKVGLLRIAYQGFLISSFPSEITVPLSEDPSVYESSSFATSPPASQVCGEDVLMKIYKSQSITDFLSAAVGTPCNLARFPPSTTGLSSRHSKAHLASLRCPNVPRPILLSNESPILAISRSSLNRLNEQIKLKDGKAVHASAFRANIVLAEDLASDPGSEQPYAEDHWQSLHVGHDVTLDILGGCHRCQMVCIDQTTAEKNQEPFVTLAQSRRKQGKVFFGVHAALAHAGQKGPQAMIKVGDRAQPLPLEAEASELG